MSRQGSPQLLGAAVRKRKQRMARTNPLQFVQQVRAEVSKVVWPTRREVLLTTVMVFIMAALTAVFFALVDLGIRSGLQGVFTLVG
jgi:preprotein translocase subunit SecE